MTERLPTTSLRRPFALLVAVLLLGPVGLSGCTSEEKPDKTTIAFLFPGSTTARYEKFDRPLFTARVQETCPACEVVVYNAALSSERQSRQVDEAVREGAEVLVYDPVSPRLAKPLVADAQKDGVKVVAYDRFIEGADHYVSFDNTAVGKLQAESLLVAMKKDRSGVLVLNGAPNDPNAVLIKAEAERIFKQGKVKVLAAHDTRNWSTDEAREFTARQIKAHGAAAIKGVYAASDALATGALEALAAAKVKAMPPVTGQDAELEAIQRIIVGEQQMTVYKSFRDEAKKAADLAVRLALGDTVEPGTDIDGVSSFVFKPVAVTLDNLADTVVRDQMYQVKEICTGRYLKACEPAGLY